jgi:hypothetical protein
MLQAKHSYKVKTDPEPLTWCRLNALDYQSGFYFRDKAGHLLLCEYPKYTVSNSKGFEGTVKTPIKCTKKDCKFEEYVLLCSWVFDFSKKKD